MLQQQKKEVIQDLKVKEKQNREISDWLAMERTLFANERTLLAYIRTALALIIAGISLFKFFQGMLYYFIGSGFIAVGLVVGVLGLRKYSRKQEQILNTRHAYTPTSPAHADILEDEKIHPAQP